MPQHSTRLRFLFRMFKLVVCAVLLLGPQVVLQLTAWSYMLISYAQESSIQEAVRDTFSGQRPCDLCHLIEAVEHEEETTAYASRATEDFRLLMPRMGRLALPSQPRQTFERPRHVIQPPNAPLATPVPPPRALG
ncbi:MAG: hypothetical protein ACLFS4_03195 [Opitutales bacterium]